MDTKELREEADIFYGEFLSRKDITVFNPINFRKNIVDLMVSFYKSKLTQPKQTVSATGDNIFMYQHEETGIIGFIDKYQVDNGFFEKNERLQFIGEYTNIDKLTQPKQTVSDAEIVKDFLDSLDKDILSDRILLKMFYNWMRDKLQAQTNEGELIELLKAMKAEHEKQESLNFPFNERELAKSELVRSLLKRHAKFKALQNTNKDD